MLGHSGDSTDLDYLSELADAGCLLGMDRFGLDLITPFEDRVATVAAMCERGYADSMVLSHDASCYIDWFPPEACPTFAPPGTLSTCSTTFCRRCVSAESRRVRSRRCWSTTRGGTSRVAERGADTVTIAVTIAGGMPVSMP